MAEMVLVVANGDWPDSALIETLLETAKFTIALDGAADRFDSWDTVVGDLDSISNPQDFKGDSNPNNTDLAKALMMYDVDAVVGISGGRLDHQLAAYAALFETKSDAILYFNQWRACRVGESGLEIELAKGTTCSVMAFGPVSEITLSGVEYELDNEDLFTSTRGVGNIVTEDEVKISHNGGDLLFIWEANAP
jgi:thiamine pyrophosphokinase